MTHCWRRDLIEAGIRRPARRFAIGGDESSIGAAPSGLSKTGVPSAAKRVANSASLFSGPTRKPPIVHLERILRCLTNRLPYFRRSFGERRAIVEFDTNLESLISLVNFQLRTIYSTSIALSSDCEGSSELGLCASTSIVSL